MTETAGKTAATETETAEKRPGRWRSWRTRVAEDRGRLAEETARQRALATAAAARSRMTETDVETAATETDAGLPAWLRWAGLWLDRIFGSLPLVSPLAVSGWYTYHVGTEALGLPWLVALALTLALEGGVWKLARLYEQTLVAGHSTIALRLGLTGYLAAIGGLIFWHAHQTGRDWRPSAVVSGMALAGLYIWTRVARWRRRHQLQAAGRIDAQAIRLSVWRWVLCPLETPAVFRHATRYAISHPTSAVSDYRLWRAAGRPKLWPPLPVETGLAETGQSEPGPVPTEPTETVAPLPSPRSVSRRTASVLAARREARRPDRPKTGLHVAGRPTDPEYVQMVRDRYEDWETRPVSAAEVMTATGLRGKPTALRIQKALYASRATTETGDRSDDDKERVA